MVNIDKELKDDPEKKIESHIYDEKTPIRMLSYGSVGFAVSVLAPIFPTLGRLE